MNYQAGSVVEYIESLPEDRIEAFQRLRETVKENLPRGFVESLSYGIPGFVIPHSLYPAGYHCKPEEPLPFISIGNQKHFIGFYHMGIYVFPDIAAWFEKEYLALDLGKPDMGKSCIRLKKMDRIPYSLLGQLCRKITAEDWIAAYEKEIRR